MKDTNSKTFKERRNYALNTLFEKWENHYQTLNKEVFDELKGQNQRSLIMMGSTYIEELVKECYLSTIILDRRKEYEKDFQLQLTFSFCSKTLYAQGYISLEILKIIDALRVTRNAYAHNFFLTPDLQKSILQKQLNISHMIDDFWNSIHSEYLKDLPKDIRNFFILIENLAQGLEMLSFWIVPKYNTVELWIKEEVDLKCNCSISNDAFDEYCLSFYEDKLTMKGIS